MRGKIKIVKRSEWESVAQSSMGSHSEYGIRNTNTYVILYPKTEGKEHYVSIDEDDIRNYYEQSRITEKLLSRLNSDLHNKYINYDIDNDGDYTLSGSLKDYISK